MDARTINELQKHAAAGAAYLDADATIEKGWAWRLGLDPKKPIIMHDPKNCGCGQIYGDYERFRCSLGQRMTKSEADEWLRKHGWYIPNEDPERMPKYEILAKAWSREARQRREKDLGNNTVPKEYGHLIESAIYDMARARFAKAA